MASPPTLLRMARDVVCEVTPIGLLVWGVVRFFSHADEVFSHRTHRINRTFLRTVSNSQDSGPSPNPSPAGRGVVCEVTPIGLLTRSLSSSFSHRTHRSNRTFPPTFRTHRTPPAYRYHRALLLFSILIRDNVKPTSFFIGVSR